MAMASWQPYGCCMASTRGVGSPANSSRRAVAASRGQTTWPASGTSSTCRRSTPSVPLAARAQRGRAHWPPALPGVRLVLRVAGCASVRCVAVVGDFYSRRTCFAAGPLADSRNSSTALPACDVPACWWAHGRRSSRAPGLERTLSHEGTSQIGVLQRPGTVPAVAGASTSPFYRFRRSPECVQVHALDDVGHGDDSDGGARRQLPEFLGDSAQDRRARLDPLVVV